MTRFFIIIISLAFTLKVSSQVYPVTTMVNLTPPYPSSLDGYADMTASKISLHIMVNDLTLSNYPVKLRLIMKSNSVTITTSQSFITSPILINGGETIVLTASDLAGYFRPENLDFSGFSKNQYLRTGQLPDGVYQITFEVIDYNRNFVISSSRMPAFAYIFVNDPPILNMPFDRAQITITGQQNILFNWTFRHSPFSRPGFIPEYRFELWEVYPENMDPYAVALATQPVFTKTLNSTSFSYTVMEPLLIPGRKYAWRVTVVDPEGITAFKEGGRSSLRWFQYGTACDAPVIKAGAIGPTHINIEWETKQYQQAFKVNYRPVSITAGEWYSGTTSMQNYRIDNLRPNTEYYVEVTGTCGTQESPVSERLRLRTKQDLAFECGKSGSMPEITNRNPLPQLRRGDYIKAGDFEVEIYEAQGANGTFSGKGFVLVPLFNFIKLEADLNNIQVNTDYQLIGGSIKTVYNINNSLMFNTAGLFGSGQLMREENNAFAEIADIKINAPDSITSVVITGNTVVVNTTGGTITEPVSEDKLVAISAPSGRQYVVDAATYTVYTQATPSGAAPSKGADGLKQAAGSEKKYTVTFSASGQQMYGFDQPDAQNIPPGNYKTRITGGQIINVPWKSVESGRFDRLDATINGQPADSVFFSRLSRNMVMVSKGADDSKRSLLITGENNNDEDELYAWYTYSGNEQDTNNNLYYAGSVNIVSYDQITADLCLVSVNGSAVPADKAALQAFLNKVYAPAVVKWNVTTLEGGLTVALEKGSGKKIDNTDPDSRMDYTDDMKLVNRAMKDHPAYNRHAVYLFFFDQGTDAAEMGYMPLSGQFGYIIGYHAASEAAYNRTIAHELAHGMFNLRHTFSNENSHYQLKGSTANLLDYAAPTATGLYKYQWDLIHDPESIWFAWMEEEEEGEITSFNPKEYVIKINNNYIITTNSDEIQHETVYFVDEVNVKINVYRSKNEELNLIKTDWWVPDETNGLTFLESKNEYTQMLKSDGTNKRFEFRVCIKEKFIDGRKVGYYKEIRIYFVPSNIIFYANNGSEEKPLDYKIDKKVKVYGEKSIQIQPRFQIVTNKTNVPASETISQFKKISTYNHSFTEDLHKWIKIDLIENGITKVTVEPVFGKSSEFEIETVEAPVVSLTRLPNDRDGSFGLDCYESIKNYKTKYATYYQNNKISINGNDYYMPEIIVTNTTSNINLILFPLNTLSIDGICKYYITTPSRTITLSLTKSNYPNSGPPYYAEIKLNIDDIDYSKPLEIKDGIGKIKGQIRYVNNDQTGSNEKKIYLFQIVYNDKSATFDIKRIDNEINKRYFNQTNIYWVIEPLIVQIKVDPAKITNITILGKTFTSEYINKLLSSAVVSGNQQEEDYRLILSYMYEKTFKPIISSYSGYHVIILHNDMSSKDGFALSLKQCCYITANWDIATISHELGHLLGLQHIAVDLGECTIESSNSVSSCPVQKATTNIMGYSGNCADFFIFQKYQIKNK